MPLFFFTVEQQERAIVERFGKFVRVAGPGLQRKSPFVEKVAGRMSGAAVPVVREAPGLSTETLLTVTNGWKGELPPEKILSSRPMRVTNLPAPARSTVLGVIW